LLDKGLNRVTDTCIPEEEAFRRLQNTLKSVGKMPKQMASATSPMSTCIKCLLGGELEQYYEIDPKDSWMIAAAEKNLPIVVPGWEDSTMGNIFASYCIKGELQTSTVKSGIEYMTYLANWYTKTAVVLGWAFFKLVGALRAISRFV
jgi:deoxyhypusine synthase